MQFDMAHCSALATLWDPSFVLASVLWAALLAYLLLEWRRTGHSMWKVIGLCLLATPLATGSLSRLVALPSASSCALLGKLLWMAIPLAIPFIALGLLQPRLDRCALFARTIVGLTCLHAWWTVTLLRDDIGQWTDPSKLVGLDEKAAHAPWFAFLGVASLVLVYILVERRAPSESWRRWAAVRLQLLLALLTLVAEIRIASPSTVFGGEPEPFMVVPIIVLVFAFVAQAVLKRRQRSAQPSVGAT